MGITFENLPFTFRHWYAAQALNAIRKETNQVYRDMLNYDEGDIDATEARKKVYEALKINPDPLSITTMEG